MARQLGRNMMERDDGDACQRELCGGKIHQRADGLMECNQCGFTFDKKYRMGGGQREGAPPVIIPDRIVTAYAKAHHAFMMEVAQELGEKEGGPVEKIDAEEQWINLSAKNRQGHWDEGKRILEKFWPVLQGHFLPSMPIEEPNVANVAATVQAAGELRNLLTEIAIPSLKYCEDKFGHDDMARLNLEAGLGMRAKP